MGNIIKVQKGTKDILPSEISLWHFMEQKALEAKIKEIEKFKAQVKAQAKEKNQSSIGGLDE